MMVGNISLDKAYCCKPLLDNQYALLLLHIAALQAVDAMASIRLIASFVIALLAKFDNVLLVHVLLLSNAFKRVVVSFEGAYLLANDTFASKNSIALTVPLTSSCLSGVVVPIPTYPFELKRMRSVDEVAIAIDPSPG